MGTKLIVSVIATVAAAACYAETLYVLRYTGSAPLDAFLATYQLELRSTVANRPIHSVADPLNRNPNDLVNQIHSEAEEDASIEVDQIIALPIHALGQKQTQGTPGLRFAMRKVQKRAFFGTEVPFGVIDQQALHQTRTIASWSAHGGGAGLVAVIDTGVDHDHPFLAPNLVTGIDLVDEIGDGSELSDLPEDVRLLINPTTTPLLGRVMVYINNGMAPTFEPFIAADSRINSLPAALGHGTMVAGAVRLVAPNAQIFPIRAFGQDGYGRLYNVIRAIHAAEDRGCKVLSMSFNTYQHSAELDRSIQEVSARGVVIIASTGNDGLTDVDSYPASISTVTGVASVDRHLVRSSFSNAGQTLTWVAAPGEALLLPWPGNRWGGAWGTSFSAPQVSGLAAKILAFNAFATYSDLQSALGRSRDVGQADLGKGFLDVFESVNGL